MTVDATGSDDFDQLVSGQETATDSSGKYFCINVPDYENTASTSDSDKQSYLRVGSAISDWTTEPGADLAALAYLVGPPGKVTKGVGKYTLQEGENAVTALASLYEDVEVGDLSDPFIDDQRSRGTGTTQPDGPAGHGLTEDERREESAALHTNVGWRDHTDGNRISTTRGDKVEVVYGNYKLIVMGRQSEAAEAMAWDVSGGSIQDVAGATAPGASHTVTWLKDTSFGSGTTAGGWLLQDVEERAYLYSRVSGNIKEEKWGDLIETYIGSENPQGIATSADAGTEGHPKNIDDELGGTTPIASYDATGLPRGNPKIIERVWADKIDSRKGSPAKKVPKIIEETHADDTYEQTLVTKAYSTQWSEIVEDYLVAGVICEGHTAGLYFRGFAGSVIDLYAGPRLATELGGSILLSAIFKFEASFGWSFSYHNKKDEMALLDTKIALANTEISGLKTGIQTVVNKIATTKTEITAATDTKISNAKTEITSTTDTKISQVETKLNNVALDLAWSHYIG